MNNNNSLQDQMDKFFKSKAFGVIGASRDRQKYGNKVLRWSYRQILCTA